jgi:DNA invertase Pin-like site-specific DNA recombinase
MPNTKVLAYSYVRFSNPSQAAGDTLRRQATLRDAWLARNGVVLDTSLSLADKGISAFSGEHRANPDRFALAGFLSLLKAGRIPKGSFLIVESLDRLSREHIMAALGLMLELVQGGVRIVQLLPAEMTFDEGSSPMAVMMMVAELSRGHAESVMKSERVSHAWREKRRRAAASREVLTARAPAWLTLTEGRWVVDEAVAGVIRRIYDMAIAGHGAYAIAKQLNIEEVPPLKNAKYWSRSYIAKVLCSPAVFGQFQPGRGRGKQREKVDEPIPGYFPVVVSETQFHKARNSCKARTGKRGRAAKRQANLFAHLVHDALYGGFYQAVQKAGSNERKLVSYTIAQGIGGKPRWVRQGSMIPTPSVSFPLASFEQAVLSCLRELDPADVLPQNDNHDQEVVLCAGRLAEVEDEIERVKARLQIKYSDGLADVLLKHEDSSKVLKNELATAQQRAASPVGESWRETKTLLDLLATAPGQVEARVRLRAALQKIIQGIWAVFVRHKGVVLAGVQVWFTEARQGACRSYLIAHQRGVGGSIPARTPEWWVCSLSAEAAFQALDLRRPDHARALGETLTEVDVNELLASLKQPPQNATRCIKK